MNCLQHFISHSMSVFLHINWGIRDLLICVSVCDLMISDVDLSDYCIITRSFPLSPSKSAFVTRSLRNFRNFDINAFKNSNIETSSSASSAASLSIDETAESYDSSMTTILDKLTPVRNKTFKVRPPNTWFDNDYRCKTPHSFCVNIKPCWQSCVGYSTIWAYHNLCDLKKSAFCGMQTESDTDNLRKMWNRISRVLGHTKAPTLSNHTVSDFTSFFTNEVEKIRWLTPPRLLQRMLSDGLDCDDLLRCRPVSYLSKMSKLLEQHLDPRINSHLESLGNTPAFQSAYRRCHSMKLIYQTKFLVSSWQLMLALSFLFSSLPPLLIRLTIRFFYCDYKQVTI